MSLTKLRILAAIVSLVIIAGTSMAVPQGANNRPLSWDQVLDYWKAEAAETLRKNITRERVTQLGVDFGTDNAREQEMVRLKMPADLISEIKKQNRTATLMIECEPECSITLNKEASGKGPANQFTTTVLAGPVNVEVSAPPSYKTRSETINVTSGEVVRRTYKLDLVAGFLNLQCEPDCSASLAGPNGFQKRVSGNKNAQTVADLPDGEYTIAVEADGFKTARSKFVVKAPDGVSASFKLAADEWAGKSAAEILELMTAAVGPAKQVAYAITTKNDGHMNITGDPASIGNWTADIIESAIPNKLRWELNIMGRKWNVVFDGSTARSGGDRRFVATDFSRELEQSIRLFSDLRLPVVLIRVRSNFDLKKDLLDDASVLVASSTSDRYIFFVDENFVPQKVVHERLLSPKSEEIEFKEYREVQKGLRLPSVMTLRYPDRPKHEQTFEFKSIDPGLALRDSYFAKP